MRTWLLALCSGLLLAACGANPPAGDAVHFDFGSSGAGGSAWPVSPGAVDVQAASWLAGPAMQYRLAYAEPLRRQSYAGSRWAAAPAELLESALRRRLAAAEPSARGAGCRLQLVLDEFEQRFDDVKNSQAVIEVRAQLVPARGGDALVRRGFRVSRPAPTADARGGVVAARDAVQGLGDDLGRWLADLARENPGILERCRT
jgi:cholesterol transport system auxiliary component